MKGTIIILLISLGSCRGTRVQTSSNWSTTPTNSTSKIKVVTNFYGGYDGLHSHCIDILTHLNFEIYDKTNPITTKPKMVFGRLVKYFIKCDTTTIIINGEMLESAIGGLAHISPRDFKGYPIVKGPDPIGTAWYEKMEVMAQATKEGIRYYSDF